MALRKMKVYNRSAHREDRDEQTKARRQRRQRRTQKRVGWEMMA
jgi:hypothetical protein